MKIAITLPILLSLTGLASACRSNEYKVEEIDTTLDAKGRSAGGTVGLNKEGEAIVQEQQQASVALTALQHVNENLRMDLKSHLYNVKTCRGELNRSRNGGTGEAPELSEFPDLQAAEKSVEKIGLEDGELKIVKTEFLNDRMKAERTHQDELRALISTVKKQEELCAFKLKDAQDRKEQRERDPDIVRSQDDAT